MAKTNSKINYSPMGAGEFSGNVLAINATQPNIAHVYLLLNTAWKILERFCSDLFSDRL